ncbi:alanine dehydrogenase [Dactylosporangium sp. NPDC000244]|uniref:alanine dehydrogenase n=1 Tax=Dactylosporangium sp. NPDC000244 TaxID=3154365 RepID=UPI003317943F
MKIGVPKEIKNHEYRVAITPAGVRELVLRGHSVVVEAQAGQGSFIADKEYMDAGAAVEHDADRVWSDSEMVLKVKEPIKPEYHRLRDGLVLFTYLHLAADRALARELLDRGVTGIAYETVQSADRTLPLLAPMSEVAGRLAPQVGAAALQRPYGGRGMLLGGVTGVPAAKVVVIGAGVAGLNATRIAVGMGADVSVIDRSLAALQRADQLFASRVRTIVASEYAIERECLDADLVIGAVLVPGAAAPKLVSNALVARMKPGAVLVDIAIDQGGCFEDSRPTTHAEPTYPVHETVFYCVANMPGAVGNTSTYALTNVTLPYVTELADHGWKAALGADRSLALGLNTYGGNLINPAVGEALGIEVHDLASAIT